MNYIGSLVIRWHLAISSFLVTWEMVGNCSSSAVVPVNHRFGWEVWGSLAHLVVSSQLWRAPGIAARILEQNSRQLLRQGRPLLCGALKEKGVGVLLLSVSLGYFSHLLLGWPALQRFLASASAGGFSLPIYSCVCICSNLLTSFLSYLPFKNIKTSGSQIPSIALSQPLSSYHNLCIGFHSFAHAFPCLE